MRLFLTVFLFLAAPSLALSADSAAPPEPPSNSARVDQLFAK